MASTKPTLQSVLDRSHLPALDGLRAVAVFAVILGHADYPIHGVPADLGVSAFFVLSGFLITRLLVREWDVSGTVSLSRFYARRTMRIFPAYYAFLLFSFVLDHRAHQQWGTTLGLSAVTYTVNYFNALHHHPTTSIAHAWSLAVEEQFYLLWPLTFLLLARRGRRWLVVGVSVLATAALARRSWLALVAHADVAYLYNAFDCRFDNLAVGCILALAVDLPRVQESIVAVARRSWYPLLTLAALLFSRLAVGSAYHYSAGFTVDAVLVAILIAQLLVQYRSVLWQWLEHPVTRYLGVISYPIYLYHAWGSSIGHHVPIGGRPGEFVAGVVATILLASGSYYVVERPFLRLKQRFAAPRARPAGVTIPPLAAPGFTGAVAVATTSDAES